MKINQIPYVIFPATNQFSLIFAPPFIVIAHNFYEMSLLKHYMLCIKRAINVQLFRLLSALMKVHPILHAIFETTRSGLFKFCITVLFNVIKDNSSVFFQLKLYVPSTKRANRSENFRLMSGCVKCYQISHVIFETTSQFSLKLFVTIFSAMIDNSSILF